MALVDTDGGTIEGSDTRFGILESMNSAWLDRFEV